MSTATIAGLSMIALPVAFNVAFAMLASRFDYPDVLRRPADEGLAAVRSGGPGLLVRWWAFAMTALLLAPTATLVGGALAEADPTLLSLGVVSGVLAALVQVLGLIRWPLAAPMLARVNADPDASQSRREAAELAFEVLNRYLGVAVGEHLGYLLTGAWTALVAAALLDSGIGSPVLAVTGLAIAPLVACSALEFLGRHEPEGWPALARVTPIAYVLWSLWLVALGITLLAR